MGRHSGLTLAVAVAVAVWEGRVGLEGRGVV